MDSVRKLKPEFVPVYTPPILTYSNSLLTTLNEDIRPIKSGYEKSRSGEGGVAPIPSNKIMNSKRGFSIDELHKLGQEQLKIELNGVVTIKSIEKFPEPTEAVLHYVSINRNC